jgi:hypothetical protein
VCVADAPNRGRPRRCTALRVHVATVERMRPATTLALGLLLAAIFIAGIVSLTMG